MKVFIVTEAGNRIGFGHLMRCISLEQAFRRKNNKPVFIVHADQSARAVLTGKNVRFLNWTAETSEFLARIRGADIVVVDSYIAGRPLYQKIAETATLG